MTPPWHDRYTERFYGADFVDATKRFRLFCAQFAPPSAEILEIGSGPANATSDYLATLGTLHGVDVDSEGAANGALESFSLIRDGVIPHEDSRFDLCVSNYVVEHVEDPDAHLAEIERVLKPGGVYVFRTPNLWHYVYIISWATPHWFHLRIANWARRLDGDAHDPWPTVYRMNTRRRVQRKALGANLIPEHVSVIESNPSYGNRSRLLFLAFVGYERVVSASDALEDLRGVILAALRKPA